MRNPKINKLEIDDIRLVKFTKNHLNKRYIEWLNDNEVVKYSEQRHVNHTFKSCNEFLNNKKINNEYFLAVEYKFDSLWKHVGNIVASLDLHNKTADLSILIGDKSIWGQGIGNRSWCLASLGLIKYENIRLITAGTMSCNKRMIKIFEKNNMTIDAVLPNRYLFSGKYADLILASNNKLSVINTAKKNNIFL